MKKPGRTPAKKSGKVKAKKNKKGRAKRTLKRVAAKKAAPKTRKTKKVARAQKAPKPRKRIAAKKHRVMMKTKVVKAKATQAPDATSGKPGNLVQLRTQPSEILQRGNAWVMLWPRVGDARGTHRHSYGLLTPYFKGLTQGKLMGTKCVNPRCPIYRGNGELWIPPRADCPDCHQPMKWEEIRDPHGYIFTYTFVERGGTGLEIECPYYQIDVKMPGVASIVKGYLVNRDRKIKIGDKVRARFRTGKDATNTCLDVCWELI